jgi:hypothetical protein
MEKDFGAKVKDLPVSLRILFKNPTFMFLNLAGACEGSVNLNIKLKQKKKLK